MSMFICPNFALQDGILYNSPKSSNFVGTVAHSQSKITISTKYFLISGVQLLLK
jgi:hypothetical protein